MQIPTYHPSSSDASWPEPLVSHPIFHVPNEAQQPQQPQPLNQAPQRRGRVLFRDSDILLAVQNQIRIASVTDARMPRAPRTYKTLHVPSVQWPIEQLAINADGRLLAVVGSHHLIVVVLPTSSRSGGRNPIIECKSIQIAPYHHGTKGSPRISKVAWHPLGEGNTSLFVLTADGVLREYDPTVDAEEPIQSFSFIQRKKKSNTFNTDDAAATEAVSFAFGCGSRPAAGARGSHDWSPLTVYGLMRGGDVLALCPVCPARIRLDLSYIKSLEAYVRGKEYLALKDRTMMSSPTPTFFPSHSFSSSTSSTVASFEELDLPTLYDHQRKYVAALSKQLPDDDASSTQNLPSSTGLTKEASISSVSTVSTVSISTKSGATAQFVTLRAPTTIKLDPEPQGPFRFQPAPAPTSTPEWDEMATDILYSCPFMDEVNKSAKLPPAVGLLLVAFADGRVDVCLDLIKVEAVWSRPGTSTHSPLLVVLETIDLEFVSHFRPNAPPQQSQAASLGKSTMAGSARPGATALQPLLTSATLHPRFLAQNFPTFVEDPVYGDTVYLYHNFGAHALWFGWIDDVGRALLKSLMKVEGEDDDRTEVLQQLVQKLTQASQEGLSSATQLLDTVDPASKITFPVYGVGVSSDLSVDYSLLAVTSNQQAVLMDLKVRLPGPDADYVGVPPALQSQIDGALAKAESKFGNPSKSTDLAKSTDSTTKAPPSSTVEPYKPVMETRPFIFPAHRPPPRPTVASDVVVARTEAAPAQLRQLAGAIGELVEYHKVVQTMPGILEERLYLLRMEQQRQLETFNNLRTMVEDLLGKGGAPGKQQRTFARLEQVSNAQPLFLKRMDSVLQRLMDSYNGTLTDSEKAWITELKRMRREIVHNNEGTGLASKAAMLSKQLELLMPDLKEIAAREKALKEEQSRTAQLGTKQLITIAQQLGSGEVRIHDSLKRTKELAIRMGVLKLLTSPELPEDEGEED